MLYIHVIWLQNDLLTKVVKISSQKHIRSNTIITPPRPTENALMNWAPMPIQRGQAVLTEIQLLKNSNSIGLVTPSPLHLAHTSWKSARLELKWRPQRSLHKCQAFQSTAKPKNVEQSQETAIRYQTKSSRNQTYRITISSNGNSTQKQHLNSNFQEGLSASRCGQCSKASSSRLSLRRPLRDQGIISQLLGCTGG